MIRFINKCFLLICLILIWNNNSAQNLFNAENSIKFARYLYSTQQYNLAANEYERILNILPNDTNVFISLLDTYRRGNICDQSFNNLKRIGTTRYFVNDRVASEYLKLSLICNCCYQEAEFTNAMKSLNTSEQIFYKAGQYTFTGEKDSLVKFIHNNQNLLQNQYPLVYSNLKRIEIFKSKKPAVAVAMSAIIPGSGKAYSGFWGDALMSLAFVSTNAWLSYQGFRKKGIDSVNGWIFGSISMGFYLGNIWGSGRAAKTYNRIEYEKIYNDAKTSFYNHF